MLRSFALFLALSCAAGAAQLSSVVVESEQGSFLINNLTVSGEGAEKSFRVKWKGAIANNTGKEWHKVTFCVSGFEANGEPLVASGEPCLLRLWIYAWKPGTEMQWKGSQKIHLADGKRPVALASVEVSVSEILTDPESVLTFSQACSRIWPAAIKTFMDSKFRPTMSDKDTFIASFEYTGGRQVAGAFGNTNQSVKAYTAGKTGWLAKWKAFRIDSASLMLRPAPDQGCRAQIDMSFAGFQKGWYKLGTNHQYEKTLLAKINKAVGEDYERDLDEAISKLPTSAPPLNTEWSEVAKFSGITIKNTDDFQISSRKLRISWKVVKDGPVGVFSVTLHKGDERIARMGGAAESHEDSSVYRSGPGEYYLKISSAGVKWEIVVEEDK